MPGRRSLALLCSAAVAAALAPAALAGAAAPSADDRAAAARAEHQRIIDYWTPERMRAAIPRDFVRQPDGSFRIAPAPKAKPGGGTGSVTGASWNADGAVRARTGKVYFVLGTQGYTCSASVADDGSPGGNSIVLTAGHCVYDEAKTDGTGWATNWLFIPDFDAMPNQGFTSSIETCRSASTKYGCWTAISLVAHAKFTTAGGFTSTATRHDFAFAMVGLGGKTGEAKSLDQELGGYRVNTDGGLQSGTSVLSAFGYPAAGKYASGADLVYCSGVIGQDRLNGNATWQLPCDMTGGSSGGPWLAAVNVVQTGPGAGDGGTLNSLNSYGYSGKSFMYGPKFNAETKKVLDRAIANSLSSTTGNAAVS